MNLPRFAAGSLGLACVVLLATATTSRANIIAGPTVDGLTTFIDQNTGLDWLRLDNFSNESPAAEIVTANAAGFVVAQTPQVQTLLNSLPLAGGQWPAYAAIMGSSPFRELIWGDYQDPANPSAQAWAWSFNGDSNWTIEPYTYSLSYPLNVVPNADIDLWAYQGSPRNSVPDNIPSGALLVLSVFGLAIAVRRTHLGLSSAR